jgi:endo-1,4-beta-xylanase
MRGHTLVFWQSIPGWFSKTVTPGNAAQFMHDHISTVCGHYAGKLHSWDVVNEGIDFSSGRPDGLRNSVWLQLLGPDYIAQAFQMARAADPNAILAYNDFGFEYGTPDQEARRRAVLALLTKLKSANAPIQALGLQTHLYSGMAAQFKPAVYQAFLKEVSDLGLKIFITEMDVQDGGAPGDSPTRDQQIADIYKQVLGTALANPAVTVVETWGLADKYSWLQKHSPRKDGLEVRTLPLDDNLQPKTVYDAIGAALDAAPARSP